ncbi:MAG: DNA-binding response regulator, partial [Cyanobacteria bacterium J083]
ILDINLPDGTGFNLCQEMSQTGAIILILSSMKDPHSILKGFEKGADDYFVKPFNLAILKAKIEALLKRYNKQEIEQNKPNQKLVFGSLSIDPNTREVKVQDTIVNLTPLEFKLLYFLATHPFVIWDRSELVAQVWEREEQVEEERKVDIHIGHIRKKIGDQEGKLIKTIWGKGYKFEPSHSDELKLAELSP